MKNFKELGEKLEKLQPVKETKYHKDIFKKERDIIEINNMEFVNYPVSKAVGVSNYLNDNYPYFDFVISYGDIEKALKNKTWNGFIAEVLSIHSRKGASL